MKILLIQPPSPPNIIGEGVAFLSEPLALEIIAAGVQHHEVKILDMRIESNLRRELENFQPDVVGTTSYTPGVYQAQNVLKKAKDYNPDILTVIGGIHATVMPEDFNKEYVDVIVIGEGDETFKELVDAYQKGEEFGNINGIAIRENERLIFAQPRKLISDLDQMPLPARHLVEKYRGEYFRQTWRPVVSLITSRGCPYRCKFCAIWKIANGKYRTRSPESVVNEIASIKERYILFSDDNTLQDIKRAEKIYQIIKSRNIKKIYEAYARADTVVRHPNLIRKWKEIGLELILIGLESFRNSELKEMNKRTTVSINEEAIRILHDNGIEIAAYFIIHPDYEKTDFDALAEYIESMNLTQPTFTILTPLPGTELYQEKFDEMITHDYELFDLLHTVLPTKLPMKEFYGCFANLYSKFFSTRNIIKRIRLGKLPISLDTILRGYKFKKQSIRLLSEAHTHYKQV